MAKKAVEELNPLEKFFELLLYIFSGGRRGVSIRGNAGSYRGQPMFAGKGVGTASSNEPENTADKNIKNDTPKGQKPEEKITLEADTKAESTLSTKTDNNISNKKDVPSKNKKQDKSLWKNFVMGASMALIALTTLSGKMSPEALAKDSDANKPNDNPNKTELKTEINKTPQEKIVDIKQLDKISKTALISPKLKTAEEFSQLSENEQDVYCSKISTTFKRNTLLANELQNPIYGDDLQRALADDLQQVLKSNENMQKNLHTLLGDEATELLETSTPSSIDQQVATANANLIIAQNSDTEVSKPGMDSIVITKNIQQNTDGSQTTTTEVNETNAEGTNTVEFAGPPRPSENSETCTNTVETGDTSIVDYVQRDLAERDSRRQEDVVTGFEQIAQNTMPPNTNKTPNSVTIDTPGNANNVAQQLSELSAGCIKTANNTSPTSGTTPSTPELAIAPTRKRNKKAIDANKTTGA